MALATLATSAFQCSNCFAQGKAAMAREVVEFVTRRFSKEVAEEGSEVLTTGNSFGNIKWQS